jgi:hypothetical protein
LRESFVDFKVKIIYNVHRRGRERARQTEIQKKMSRQKRVRVCVETPRERGRPRQTGSLNQGKIGRN